MAFRKRMPPVVIPVVFHVFHNNEPENIDDTQILKGLEHLNQAFANEGPYKNDKGVDVGVQFCLAQRDELGNAFSGILRYESIYTDMSIAVGYGFVASKILDKSKYLNIHLVKEACLGNDCVVAGYAGTNRVVVEAKYIGSSKASDVVLIHELGHALGLAHTWKGGCKNNDCLKDGDRVCDTPPDNRTFEHCFALSNSCQTDSNDNSINNPFRSVLLGGLGDQVDDHSNFMDYNFEECLTNFTQGQADRMQFILQSRYKTLLTSKVCLPPCDDKVLAAFSLPDSISLGSVLNITNLSNFADQYQWLVDGKAESTAIDLNYTFSKLGYIQVTLEAYTDDVNCETAVLTKSIWVYCPAKACMDYRIVGQYLIFEDCSENVNAISWTVTNARGDTLRTSMNVKDSMYVNNIEFVRLCLNVEGEYCSETKCVFVTIVNNGTEICGNEQDDDGDGLIDLFDPDCPCDATVYQAQCPQTCLIVPDSFPEIKMKMKWESENLSELNTAFSTYVVGDVNNDNLPEIIFSAHSGKLNTSKNFISILNGTSGNVTDKLQVFPEYTFWELSQFPGIYRDRISNKVGIVIKLSDFYCGSLDGSENFRTSFSTEYRYTGFSDFNNDGFYEFYTGCVVFNGQNGKVLFTGNSRFCDNSCAQVISIAADVIGNDGKLELITGKYVYELELNNTSDTLGNFANIIEAPVGVEDGKCAVADFDGDGLMEIIVLQSSNKNLGIQGNLTVWNPRTKLILANIPNPILNNISFDGSLPLIGDVDGDCIPEICVIYNQILRIYKFNNIGSLEILYELNTSDLSSFTGVTMFDFNQDGKQELVYRDETFLRIIKGDTGETIDSFQLFSKTGSEYPIIADIDNDGDAEIIISGSQTNKNENRIYCFESATSAWAPARSVWNQYAYNPTQVNDDLTIPRYQQNAAKPLQGKENCPQETCATPYNNFMAQATYRTQEGCFVWPELQRDLSVTATSRCIGDSLEICFIAKATDGFTMGNGVAIACYSPPWDSGNAGLIDRIVITDDTTCIMMARIPGLDSMMIVINDEGGYYPPDFPNTSIPECDYTNNDFVLQLNGPDFSIDVLDYTCTSASLVFYIAVENIGAYTDVNCIGGGCYFLQPNVNTEALEVTSWCFKYDSISGTYQQKDTFRVVIPIPIGQTKMWWTINDFGFGPGLPSSLSTGIYECNYNNNVDSISFDISTKTLDLGPDIVKCATEVTTLNARAGFTSYLWNDLTIDSIYSATNQGLHFVEARDQCGRVYADTVSVTIDQSVNVDLGGDFSLCMLKDTTLTITGTYDRVQWLPSYAVDCDTCMTARVNVDTSLMLVVMAQNNNCFSFDTIQIKRIIPEEFLVTKTYCLGDTIDVFGQKIASDGTYQYLTPDCTRMDVLEVIFEAPDTTNMMKQICENDSLWFNGQYLDKTGMYNYLTTNAKGCDSTVVLYLRVVNEIFKTDTMNVCKNDSIKVFNQWFQKDTTIQKTFTSANVCDSIQTIMVKLLTLPQTNLNLKICSGDSVYTHNRWFATAGNYQLKVSNSGICDSLIFLNIAENKLIASFDTIIACQGDTINLFNSKITNNKDISNTYTASDGCDSLSQF